MSTFRTPHRILLGGGVRHEIGDAAAELGVRRPLIVTDAFHASNGVADELVSMLTGAGLSVGVFAETVPDPTVSSVDAGVASARQHDADAMIGLGGGSPLDTAKAIALLAVRGGTMRDYRAPAVTTGDALPIIAVPTTAGSGSEATQFTIITDAENSEKMLCVGPVFLPRVAVVDFELSLTMPPRLTADTGVDALTHAIEAYVSRRANPLSDVFALRAMALVGANLVTAYRDGADRGARENMMLASLLAGIAFSNSSVALVHGMSRPIGAQFGIAHGLSNAVLFAEVTRYSLPGALARYADCARALGVAAQELPDPAAADALVAAIVQLTEVLGVPALRNLGVAEDAWRRAIPDMAGQALASGSPANNPVVPEAGDIRAIYERIFERGA
ncbi:iron-containing alcohol dehydrogenase [soil metagenome]